jgi:hypothetical protein
MKKSICSSETLADFQRSALQYIPGDENFLSQRFILQTPTHGEYL